MTNMETLVTGLNLTTTSELRWFNWTLVFNLHLYPAGAAPNLISRVKMDMNFQIYWPDNCRWHLHYGAWGSPCTGMQAEYHQSCGRYIYGGWLMAKWNSGNLSLIYTGLIHLIFMNSHCSGTMIHENIRYGKHNQKSVSNKVKSYPWTWQIWRQIAYTVPVLIINIITYMITIIFNFSNS